ncbi:MAG: hypothetical protein AAFV77_08980 [Planctomycetota bacterium]
MQPRSKPNSLISLKAIRLFLLSVLAFGLVAFEVGHANAAWQDDGVTQALTAVPASRQAEKIVSLPIRTAIDEFTMKGLEQRLERAEREGVQAVVIELDTPGGEVGAVLEISNLLKTTQVPIVVAWVNNEAFSGGAIIAMACGEIVTNDPATLGDAIPIQIAPIFGLQQMTEETKQKILAPLIIDLVDSARRNGYDEKLVQGFVSLGVELWQIERTRPGPEGQPVGERMFIDIAEYRLLFGEPPEARTPQIPSVGTGQTRVAPEAEGTEERGSQGDTEGDAEGDEGLGESDPSDDATAFQPAAPELQALDAESDLSKGLVVPTGRPTLSEGDRGGWKVVAYATDGKAPVTMTSEQLVAYGVATEVAKTDEELKAFFGASEMVRYEESIWMVVARFMSHWIVRGLLIVVVLVGFFVEMASPGLGFPGAIALLALIGLLAPSAMVGLAGWWEFLFLGIGILLVLLEVFVVPGLGVPGVVGAVLVFVGLLGTFTGGGTFQTQQDLITGVVVLLLSLGTASVIIFFIAKNLSRIPILSGLVLQSTPVDDEEQSPTFFSAMAPEAPAPVLSSGTIGEAVGVLRPSGRARFGEELVDVVSVGPVIENGQSIRVVESTGFRVMVEPADEPESGSDGGSGAGPEKEDA